MTTYTITTEDGSYNTNAVDLDALCAAIEACLPAGFAFDGEISVKGEFIARLEIPA